MNASTQGKSVAYFVGERLQKPYKTLHDWEIMKVVLVDWIENQVSSQTKYYTKLEQQGESDKAYRTKMRIQNYMALGNVVAAMYEAMLQNALAAPKLIRAKQIINRQSKALRDMHLALDAATQSEQAINECFLIVLNQHNPQTQQQYEAALLNQMKNDPQFLDTVEFLHQNGVTQL